MARSFDALRVSYDPGRRALLADPGEVLTAGRERVVGIILDPLASLQNRALGRS